MHIRFKCLKCNQKIKVSKEAIGKKCECPRCNNICRVPSDPSEWLTPSDQASQEPPLELQGESEVKADGLQHVTCSHCEQIISTPEALTGKEILCPHCDQQICIPKGTSPKTTKAKGNSQEEGRFSAKNLLKLILSWIIFFVLLIGIMSLYEIIGSALFDSVDFKIPYVATFERLEEVYDDESIEEMIIRIAKTLKNTLPENYNDYEISKFRKCQKVFEDRIDKAEISLVAKGIGRDIIHTCSGLHGCWEEAQAGGASFALGGMIGIGEKNLRDQIRELEKVLNDDN